MRYSRQIIRATVLFIFFGGIFFWVGTPSRAPDEIAAARTPAPPPAATTINRITTLIPAVLTSAARFPLPTHMPPDDEGIVITLTPTPLRPPEQVNGMRFDRFIILPENTRRNIRMIYERGQELGRNAHAFTRIGDSTIEPPFFLTSFDTGDYNLGDYVYLQGVIDYYAGSFAHNSIAVRRGLVTWSVLDPLWATGTCEPGEHMLSCEFRLHNPAIIFVRLGSNDRGVPQSTERNLRAILDYCIEQGVIPILGTKADRFDGSDSPNNTIIRQLAAEYRLPLWDFDLIAETLPNRGLVSDGVHMTAFFSYDWREPEGFTTGHGVHNLTALIVLDQVWRALEAD